MSSTTQTKIINCRTCRAAASAIVRDLGYEVPTSIQASLAALEIREDLDNEHALADVYTHPDLPGREYYVSWG